MQPKALSYDIFTSSACNTKARNDAKAWSPLQGLCMLLLLYASGGKSGQADLQEAVIVVRPSKHLYAAMAM